MGLNILTAAGAVNHGSSASLDSISIGTECHLLIPSAFNNGARFSYKSAGAGTLHTMFTPVPTSGNFTYAIQGTSTLIKESTGAPLVANRLAFIAATFSFAVSGGLWIGNDQMPVRAQALATDLNGSGTPGDDSAASQWIGATDAGTQPSLANHLFWAKWRRMLLQDELETVRQWALWLSGVSLTPPLNDAIPWRDCVAWVPYGATDVAQVDYSPERNHGLGGGARCTPPAPITDPYPWQPPLPTQLFPSL